MTLIGRIRSRVGCCEAKNCKSPDCTVSLNKIPAPPARLVLDCDKPGLPFATGEKRCDYLIFVEEGVDGEWVVPLELKKGKSWSIPDVVGQLQSGANAAERLVRCAAGAVEKCRFKPVLASGGMRKGAVQELRKRSVKFGNRNMRVERIRCGDVLAGILK